MANHYVLAICHFQLRKKNDVYKTSTHQKNKWCFLKLWHCWLIWYLLAGFKIVILCSGRSIWFVKNVFFAKIWFVKTSTRIVKYESRVVKSSPEAELPALTQSSGKSFRILMQALFSADVLKKVPERQYVFKFFF